MKKKVYRIEMESTTYHTWQVEAESPKQAQLIAYNQMDNDEELSHDWKVGAGLCAPNRSTTIPRAAMAHGCT